MLIQITKKYDAPTFDYNFVITNGDTAILKGYGIYWQSGNGYDFPVIRRLK